MYYIRLHLEDGSSARDQGEFLNLLFKSDGGSPSSAQKHLTALLTALGDLAGALWWFDRSSYCLRLLRSREVRDCRIYLYDEEAPVSGVYVPEVSALGGGFDEYDEAQGGS